ncbi:MAG: DNA alkylation repair protein [Patescibacteria group bacterium]
MSKTQSPHISPPCLTATAFIAHLHNYASVEDRNTLMWFFKTGPGEYGEGDEFIGVKQGPITALAKQNLGMSIGELEQLLESPLHEARMGAVKIMALEAAKKKTTQERRAAFYELYLRRTDRINNWDLVDVSAPQVVGGYLYDYQKPREQLYALARSKNLWEKRIGILSTLYFIRQGEYPDTLAIAEILLHDPHDLIHKAVGWMLREVGKKDKAVLCGFLDAYAWQMPRTMLRYAIERLKPELRKGYMEKKTKETR